MRWVISFVLVFAMSACDGSSPIPAMSCAISPNSDRGGDTWYNDPRLAWPCHFRELAGQQRCVPVGLWVSIGTVYTDPECGVLKQWGTINQGSCVSGTEAGPNSLEYVLTIPGHTAPQCNPVKLDGMVFPGVSLPKDSYELYAKDQTTGVCRDLGFATKWPPSRVFDFQSDGSGGIEILPPDYFAGTDLSCQSKQGLSGVTTKAPVLDIINEEWLAQHPDAPVVRTK